MRRWRASSPILGITLLVSALVLAACGSTSATASPAASSTGAPGDAIPGATPRWPGTVVLAVVALGAADNEIAKAGVDLTAATAAEDLKAMWGAADGLIKLIDGLLTNVDRIEDFEATRTLAMQYYAAFPAVREGAIDIRDGISAGDAKRIQSGSQKLARGLLLYSELRPALSVLLEQAFFQQRLLLQ